MRVLNSRHRDHYSGVDVAQTENDNLRGDCESHERGRPQTELLSSSPPPKALRVINNLVWTPARHFLWRRILEFLGGKTWCLHGYFTKYDRARWTRKSDRQVMRLTLFEQKTTFIRRENKVREEETTTDGSSGKWKENQGRGANEKSEIRRMAGSTVINVI